MTVLWCCFLTWTISICYSGRFFNLANNEENLQLFKAVWLLSFPHCKLLVYGANVRCVPYLTYNLYTFYTKRNNYGGSNCFGDKNIYLTSHQVLGWPSRRSWRRPCLIRAPRSRRSTCGGLCASLRWAWTRWRNEFRHRWVESRCRDTSQPGSGAPWASAGGRSLHRPTPWRWPSVRW